MHPLPRRGLPTWVNRRRLDRLLYVLTACAVLLLVGLGVLMSLGSDDEQPRLTIAESLLSNDDRTGPMEKVDSSGHFQRYEGVTTVMFVNDTAHHAVFQQAYDLVYTLFGGIVSPLPVDSYHVTLSTVAVRAKAKSLQRYNALMSDNHARLEGVKWQLTNNAREAHHAVTFRVEGARLGSRGISLTLQPSSDLDAAELRRLNALLERSLGRLYERQPRWHMSVAYRHLGLSIEPAEFAPLQSSLMDIFRNVEVSVLPPVLCAFYDMRQFRPL